MHLPLLLALIAAPPPPPAKLVIPDELRRAREAEAAQDRKVQQLGLLAPEVLAAAAPLRPHPGEWVEYAVRVKGQPSTRVRLSVLPPPADAPADRYALEVFSVGVETFPAVVRLLVHGNPANPADVERATLYLAGQAPIELPLEDSKEPLQATRLAAPPPVQVDRRGAREQTVAAGTFKADEVRVRAPGGTTRLWLSRDVPLWGLVRAQTGDRSVELFQFGRTGAHSVIPPAPGEAPAQGNGSDQVK